MPNSCLRRIQTVLTAIVLIVTVAYHATPAAAQSTFATLTGVVTDQGGGVLPGATVTATNTTTGVVRTVVAGGAGEYQVPNLDAGSYLVQVQLSGFADVSRAVDLLARRSEE